MNILAIDQGTTSTRAIGINEQNKIEVLHSISHKQHFPNNGWVEQDPDELYQNINACIRSSGKNDFVGFDNQGESCLAWHADTKEALSPVISWQDTRTATFLNELKKNGNHEISLSTAGLPLEPYFSASKLGWTVSNLKSVKQTLKAGKLRLGTTDAFFLDRLTGNFLTDVTTASRTSLMDLKTLDWDPQLCKMFGVPIECLPEITSSTRDFGVLESHEGKPCVSASIVDQQAALYGSGCNRIGDLKITFGTGAFALVVTGDSIVRAPSNGLIPTLAWHFEDEAPVYALDGGVFTASSCVDWAKSLGLFNEFSEINNFSSVSAIDNGLAFVPALSGLGSPHWEPKARGLWLGLGRNHSRLQLMQAILEGIAFRAAEVVIAMRESTSVSETIIVDGGMSRNSYFIQFLADVCGYEILLSKIPENTGLGTLKLASRLTGKQLYYENEGTRVKPVLDRRDDLEKFKHAISFSKKWSELN